MLLGLETLLGMRVKQSGWIVGLIISDVGDSKSYEGLLSLTLVSVSPT